MVIASARGPTAPLLLTEKLRLMVLGAILVFMVASAVPNIILCLSHTMVFVRLVFTLAPPSIGITHLVDIWWNATWVGIYTLVAQVAVFALAPAAIVDRGVDAMVEACVAYANSVVADLRGKQQKQ